MNTTMLQSTETLIDFTPYTPKLQTHQYLRNRLCELCVLGGTTDYNDYVAVNQLSKEFSAVAKTFRYHTNVEEKSEFSFFADTGSWGVQSVIAGHREEARRLAELEAYLDLIEDQPLHSVKRSALGMQFNLALYWLAYHIFEYYKDEEDREGKGEWESNSHSLKVRDQVLTANS